MRRVGYPFVIGFVAMSASLLTSAKAQDSKDYFAWTGPYAGLTLGVGRADTATTMSPNSLWYTSGLASDTRSVNFLTANSPDNLSSRGLTGGGQIGYNWQINSFVFGVEADIARQKLDVSSDRGPLPNPPNSPQTYKEKTSARWLGTARLRAGFAFNSILLYATAGLALTYHDQNATLLYTQVNYSTEKAAWTSGGVFGGGIEYAINANWMAKAEYLHINSGALNATGFKTINATGVQTQDYAITHSSKMTEQLVRAGLNYKF
ncbi:MAG: outer membrane beta-barrel protein [Hyphomicrobiaceae bacterium]|nr:porin family protein [Hyphomicrobiaceae bacterium]